jgi:hypothetical protein
VHLLLLLLMLLIERIGMLARRAARASFTYTNSDLLVPRERFTCSSTQNVPGQPGYKPRTY